jgi:nicotinamidase-related amidase
MNYSLVIIDMQPSFIAAKQSSLRKPILREIALAKKHNRQIIVVHFARYGRTINYILKELKGYKNKSFVRKNDVDGSDKTNRVLKNNNVRICGIEASECVFETASGLSKMGFNVSLVKDACGDCIEKNVRQTKGNDFTLDTFTEAIDNGMSVIYPNRHHQVRCY